MKWPWPESSSISFFGPDRSKFSERYGLSGTSNCGRGALAASSTSGPPRFFFSFSGGRTGYLPPLASTIGQRPCARGFLPSCWDAPSVVGVPGRCPPYPVPVPRRFPISPRSSTAKSTIGPLPLPARLGNPFALGTLEHPPFNHVNWAETRQAPRRFPAGPKERQGPNRCGASGPELIHPSGPLTTTGIRGEKKEPSPSSGVVGFGVGICALANFPLTLGPRILFGPAPPSPWTLPGPPRRSNRSPVPSYGGNWSPPSFPSTGAASFTTAARPFPAREPNNRLRGKIQIRAKELEDVLAPNKGPPRSRSFPGVLS